MAGFRFAVLLPLFASSLAAASFDLPSGPHPLYDTTVAAPEYFDVEPFAGPVQRDSLPLAVTDDWVAPALHADPERTELLRYRRSKGFGKYAEWLGKDIVNVFATPVHWSAGEWQMAVIGTGGIVVLSRVDDPVSNWFMDHPSDSRSSFLNGVSDLYGPSSLTMVSAALFGSGLVAGNEQLADTGFLALESMMFAHLTSSTLKNLTQRYRPKYADQPFQFAGPQGSGTSSFVSMDTISAFAFASSVSEMVPRRWVRWSLYSLAGLIAVQRIDAGAHWLTDVAGAAVLGHYIGKRTVRLHYRRNREGREGLAQRLLSNVKPVAYDNAMGVTVTIDF